MPSQEELEKAVREEEEANKKQSEQTNKNAESTTGSSENKSNESDNKPSESDKKELEIQIENIKPVMVFDIESDEIEIFVEEEIEATTSVEVTMDSENAKFDEADVLDNKK